MDIRARFDSYESLVEGVEVFGQENNVVFVKHDMPDAMPQYQDDQQLRDAIKTTLVQLCKVGLIFQTDVCIEGTIGLTIDRRKVFLIHFDEVFSSPEEDHGLHQPAPQHQVAPPSSFNQSNPQGQEQDLDNLRLLGAEALSSLHEYLSRPLVSQSQDTELGKVHTKDTHTFSDNAGKMLTLNETIAINLDSEEESFGDMNFDEDMSEVKVKAFHENHRGVDVKNIIVIDDNDLFNPGNGSVDDAFDHTNVASTDPLRPSLSDHTVTSVTSVPNTNVAETSLHTTSARTAASSQVDTGFECEECSKLLPSQSLLEAHLVSTHDITESSVLGKIVHYSCPHCSKKFRFMASLNKHATKHLGERTHRCNLCHNSYHHSSSLEIHMEVHTNSLHCRKCNKTYASKNLLQKHIMYMHENALPKTKSLRKN